MSEYSINDPEEDPEGYRRWLRQHLRNALQEILIETQEEMREPEGPRDEPGTVDWKRVQNE